MRPTRAVITFAAIAVLGAAGYTAFWFAAADRVATELEAWAAQGHAGLDISVGDITVTGFPTALRATVGPVEVRAGGDLAYRVAAIDVSRPLRGEDLAFVLRGPQVITVEGTVLTLTAERTTGELVRRGDGSIAGFNVEARAVALQRPDAQPVTAQRVAIRAGFPATPGLVPSGTKMTVRADALTIPEQRRGAFGDTIQLALLNFAIDGALQGSSPVTAVRDWQRQGGRLYLTDSTLRWGTLDLPRLGGNLRLDTALRPAGWLDALFRNPAPMFEALAAADWIGTQTRVELMNGVAHDPNRVPTVQYRLSLLDGRVVFDDIEQDQTVPIPLWTLPSLAGVVR